MTQPNEKSWEEEFDEKFNSIDINESGFNEDGESDGLVIIDKEGLSRYGLESIKSFIKSLLTQSREEMKGELVREIEKSKKHCDCNNGHVCLGINDDEEAIWDGCQTCVDKNGQYVKDRNFTEHNDGLQTAINLIKNYE